MRAKLQRLLTRESSRYVIVGGTVYMFELAAILIAQWMGAGPLLAVGLSFWLGLLLSFLIQKFITFKDKRTEKRVVARQFLVYLVLIVWNFGFTLLVTRLLIHTVPAVVSRTIALGITTIWNYYFYKTRIFKPSLTLEY